MKCLNDMLQLGHPKLYEVCEPVEKSDLVHLENWVNDIDNTTKKLEKPIILAEALLPHNLV